jgi:DNA-binding YbaB/EbfC family protein
MGFFDQMKQMMEMKTKMEEVKNKLDSIEVYAENELVRVVANGNRRIKDITIKGGLEDKLTLENRIAAATNEAMEKAEAILQKEFAAVSGGMFPNMPGM